MFDDKELNNQNTSESEKLEQTEGGYEQPEYVNSEDNNNSQDDSLNQSYYDGQNSSGNQSYYDSQSNSGNQNYYNNQDNDSQSYYNNQNTNSGQNYYNTQDNNGGQNYYDSQRNYYDYNSGNSNSSQNKNNKKGNKNIAIVASIAVAAVVLVGGIVFVTSSVMDNANKAFHSVEGTTEESKDSREYPTIASTVADNNSATNTATNTGVYITDVSNVVSDVMPSIVAITSTTMIESNGYGSDWFWGNGYGSDGKEQYEEVGAGSGIIVKQTDTELLIVTNNHVVTGADSLTIQFVNGTSIKGTTKSTDEEADIAIVSIALSDIDSDTLNAIKIATLGSSDDLNVGEGVVAIGNALGYGQSVTTGVISAKDREIDVDDKTMVVLQTDAAINGGNSGGALLNSKGEVIGINVAKYSSSSYSGSASIEGMGFAIPISQATDIINDLMSKETRAKVDESEQGVLGIQAVNVTAANAEMYSIPQGILIKEVVVGGAAEKAGLRTTDVITKFDGQSLSTVESLQEKLQYYKAGEKVTLTIQRNTNGVYEEMEIEVTLSSANILEDSTTK